MTSDSDFEIPTSITINNWPSPKNFTDWALRMAWFVIGNFQNIQFEPRCMHIPSITSSFRERQEHHSLPYRQLQFLLPVYIHQKSRPCLFSPWLLQLWPAQQNHRLDPDWQFRIQGFWWTCRRARRLQHHHLDQPLCKPVSGLIITRLASLQ